MIIELEIVGAENLLLKLSSLLAERRFITFFMYKSNMKNRYICIK